MPVDRPDPPLIADEREMLVSWLDWQRATLAQKCEDLTREQLAERSVPPSSLSLLGLLQHMIEVERSWFRRCLGGEQIKPVYYSDAEPDGDFDNIDPARAEEVRAEWEAECERSRAAVTAAASLDVTGRTRRGSSVSLRWILVHMIEEYARHNGHADFLRERIDGRTGD
jgi:uncharacterized damage-inducible protein DinB